MAVTVLVIGKTSKRHHDLVNALDRHYVTLTASSGKRAQEALSTAQPVHIVVLNANSMNTSGNRIARELKKTYEHIPIVHIYPDGNTTTSQKSPAEVIMQGAISGRRLINSIERLLNNDNDEVLRYGPFTMNISRRILIAHGKETQLTPKQARLVETFLRNPGKTIGRKELMEQVWNTDYLGDTRTLDVHIRWIRKIMETDSKKPCYLRTVRGVGYRLAMPDTS